MTLAVAGVAAAAIFLIAIGIATSGRGSGVSARLERNPLRRRLVLSGPADDFQRAELVQILADIPGVAGVRWASPPIPSDRAR